MKLSKYQFGLWLSTLSLLIAGIESIKYPGFIHKHLHFSPSLVYVITGIAIITIKLYPPPSPEKMLLPILFRYLAIGMGVISGILLSLEAINYPNFVFSTIHIHLDGLQIMTLLIFIYFLLSNLKHIRYHSLTRETIMIVMFALVLNFTFAAVINDLKLLSKEFKLMQNAGDTDSQKQHAGWGDIYLYTQLLNRSTPHNATIAFPPAQNHWLYSGNVVLMRYFVYPRSIVNLTETGSEETLAQLPAQTFDYIALAWGESNELDLSPYGWPKQAVKTEYIDYFDLVAGTSERVIVNQYTPTGVDTPVDRRWGVIKVAN